MAEPLDLLCLVEDIASDLHISHDVELFVMLQQLQTGDLGCDWDGVLRQPEILSLVLDLSKGTS